MKHQDLVKIAEEVVSDMKNKKSIEKIQEHLNSKGYYPSDVNKIMFRATNIIEDEFGAKIKSYLQAGTLEQNKSEFIIFDASVLESIKLRLKKIISEETANKIKQMAIEGKHENDIIRACVSPCVTEDQVKLQLDNYRMYVELPKGDKKYQYIMKGIGATLLGFILLLFGVRLISSGGLIGFGLYNFVMAYSPKGSTNNY